MNVITRFAPSPTGLLHVGNIRTALIDWLFTRKQHGKFILRIDDTDLQRSSVEFENQLKDDLRWLGLTWDETFNQKDRVAKYDEVTKHLIKAGRLYPCYETKEDLDLKRKIQLSQGNPPIYDRASLRISHEQITQYEAEGRKPHYRFKLNDGTISWHDLIREQVSFESNVMSDPILIREDGTWTYMLCSAIDDIDYNITHVIRGEDHITNTAINIQIFEALGKKPPVFAHVSRVTSKTSEMSKRLGGFDIKSLRDQGIEPMTVINFLSTIGTSKPASKFKNTESVIENFDIENLSKSPSVYDEKDLWDLNHKILAQLSFEEIQPRLHGMAIDKHFWLNVRNNISKFSEFETWYNMCKKPVKPIIMEKDHNFLEEAAKFLETYTVLDENTWESWITTLKSHTPRKGKDLFMPIRLALTGLEHGPELKFLLPLITKETSIKRLLGETT